MNPKVVFRCFFISVLLAAPTPLLLAGIVHLTNAPLAEQWLAEAAFSVYAAVAFGCPGATNGCEGRCGSG